MQDFDVGNLVGSVAAIANFGQSAPAGHNAALAIPERNRQDILGHIANVISQLERLDLSASLISAREVRKIVTEEATLDTSAVKMPGEPMVGWPPLSTGRLKNYCKEMQARVRDELLARRAFMIPTNKVDYYEPQAPLFGEDIRDRFPSTAFEIDEAGKCFALGRWTACVFHLMRVMEIGIQATARNLGVPDPAKPSERNWGAILRAINEAISQKSPGAEKDFLQSTYALLDAVRNAWRNATMHVENKYIEEEAADIFGAVRGFMRRIASVFDEKGDPIP